MDDMKLWTTEGYDEMSWEELTKIANGCGPTDCKWCGFVLDSAMGLPVFDACAQHDYDYEVGGTRQDKREDDIRFICNLLIIALSRRSFWNLFRVPYLFAYYVAVHWGGREHFNWTDVEQAPQPLSAHLNRAKAATGMAVKHAMPVARKPLSLINKWLGDSTSTEHDVQQKAFSFQTPSRVVNYGGCAGRVLIT
ncbi:MAG: hypothetical protein KAG66_21580 [Methylococcales bacterium]|nr:hypothetical protein [Methylococcales bacterium]